ncbi:MAG: response regulator [Pirellulaceae bacterium]
MKNILLVDDDNNLMRGLRRSLRDQPYQFFEAESAEWAMNVFRYRKIDLALIDNQMGLMSGIDLAEWIAQHHPATVRLMLTGHANVRVAQDAINRGGVFRFLLKPIRHEELADAIAAGLKSVASLECNPVTLCL